MSSLKSSFVSYTPLKFSSILQRPSQILLPSKSLPRSLRCNEVSLLLHYQHIWFYYSIVLVSICFRRKLSSLESSRSVLLTSISLIGLTQSFAQNKCAINACCVKWNEIKTVIASFSKIRGPYDLAIACAVDDKISYNLDDFFKKNSSKPWIFSS